MKYQLIKTPCEELDVERQILVNRNIDKNLLSHYLSTTDEDINSFELLDNIKDGAKILITAIKNDADVINIVDSDCDGMTSSAISANFLYDLFPVWTIQHLKFFFHAGKSHNLSELIERQQNYSGVGLILCPDCGSNDIREHEYFKNLNIPVLVLDHHDIETEVSHHAITINNMACNYPNKSFSGAGIVWQFCRYLNYIFNNSSNYVDNYYDLMALGLMADMEEMTSIETKHLIWKGFEERNIKNPFIEGMIKKNQFSLNKADYLSYRGLACTPMGAAFFIAPFVNAISRSGTLEEKEIVFNSMLKYKALKEIPSTKRGHKEGDMETIVDAALRICTNVKNRQTKAQDAGLEYLENQIQSNEEIKKNKVLLFLVNNNQINSSIAGLCANKLATKYQRPCCILYQIDKENEEEELYAGSARGCELAGIADFKQICLDSGQVVWCKGHANAFGLCIDKKNIPEYFNYTNEVLKDISTEPVYYVDYEIEEQDINLSNIISEIAKMNDYWGKGLNRAYIAVKFNVTPDNFKVMGSNTLKFVLHNNISAIKFNGTEEEIQNLSIEKGCLRIEAVCKCNLNSWNGKITPQLLIEDYNIVQRIPYFF